MHRPTVDGEGSRPFFSLVVAVHDVEPYLPEFLGSLDAQTFPHDRVQVVLVDDGSSDGSLGLLRGWAGTTDHEVVVLTQDNAGQSVARNEGLQRATGTWVSFPDPDDELVAGYLGAVHDELARHPDVDVVACRFVMRYDVKGGDLVDDHPLRYRFEGPARVRDLEEDPGHFFVNPAAGFYPRERLEESGLRFDPRVRPSFEDGHFGAHYLLAQDRPRLLFVPEAAYHYRKRAQDSSTLTHSLADPRRYTDVFRHGYLDVLESAVRSRGAVPAWLSRLVLYDLSWLLRAESRSIAEAQPHLMAVAEEFHGLMARISRLVDSEEPSEVRYPRFVRLWRDVLAHGWGEEEWRSSWAMVSRADPVQGLVRLFYHYRGAPPVESFEVGGEQVEPAYATRRPFSMLGRTLVHERVVWVPLEHGLTLALDGRPVELWHGGPRRAAPHLLEGRVARQVPHVATPVPFPRRDPRRVWRRLSRSRRWRERFADAWVLMDRIHNADDSAERLFEHLRAERTDVNAWFVVERGTEAWRSLRRRHGRRVVAHGSARWRLLMFNAAHLVSSHADAGIVRPGAVVGPGEPVPWRFTFLQHGIIKDDLSAWLNPKNFDTFVTSTRAESESVVGDSTGYLYTRREVVLTGLPRFDRLLRLAQETSYADRDLLLVCPTWRNWLAMPLAADSQRREATDDFLESDFAREWLALLRSPELEAAAADNGLRVVFLPHPNLEGHLGATDLPAHVELMGFEGTDVQQVFARCALMVTDYSSMAFNAAYLDRPVVYHQFDRDRMFGGEHVGVGGYFDYERDGFGPVTTSLEEALSRIAELGAGRSLPETYAARVRDAFPERDGRCCERVVAAIEASARPVGRARLRQPAAD